MDSATGTLTGRVIVPKANAPKSQLESLEIVAVTRLVDALRGVV